MVCVRLTMYRIHKNIVNTPTFCYIPHTFTCVRFDSTDYIGGGTSHDQLLPQSASELKVIFVDQMSVAKFKDLTSSSSCKDNRYTTVAKTTRGLVYLQLRDY